MQVLRVEYDCCGAVYHVPSSVDGQTLVFAYSEVADGIIAKADRQHVSEHPDCPAPGDNVEPG